MAEVNFDDENNTTNTNQNRQGEGKGASGLTGTVQNKFGLTRSGAKNVLIAVGVIAFLISLYFWFSLL